MNCAIPNCENPVLARGWCSKHWQRWYKKGDPLAGRDYGHAAFYFENFVLAWESDNCLLWPFGTATHGYGVLRGTTVPRLVCTAIHGPPPFARAEAAHTCHVRLCVNHRHLYWGTRQQNEDDKLRVYAKRGRYSQKLDELH